MITSVYQKPNGERVSITSFNQQCEDEAVEHYERMNDTKLTLMESVDAPKVHTVKIN